MQGTASLTLTGTASVGRFGAAAAGAGDVDADGYADLVIGAAGADGDRGAAYLYRGAAGYAAKDEGCGCAAGPRAGAGWIAGLAALALLRRRRR